MVRWSQMVLSSNLSSRLNRLKREIKVRFISETEQDLWFILDISYSSAPHVLAVASGWRLNQQKFSLDFSLFLSLIFLSISHNVSLVFLQVMDDQKREDGVLYHKELLQMWVSLSTKQGWEWTATILHHHFCPSEVTKQLNLSSKWSTLQAGVPCTWLIIKQAGMHEGAWHMTDPASKQAHKLMKLTRLI